MASSISHTRQCKPKMLQLKQAPNLNLSHTGQHNSTTDDNKNIYSICWSPIKMAYNRYCDTSGKVYRSSESANNPLNFNNNWQKTAVRITNTTKSPYLIKKNTQIAEFSVVTPEQSKFIRQQFSVWFRKVIRIWLLIWVNYSEQTNQNNRVILSGFRNPKILEKPRITLQNRHES